MNTAALFHSIRLRVPTASDARHALRALGSRLGNGRQAAPGVPPVAAGLQAVTFRTMVSSAVVEVPRRVHWHPLAVLDLALTGAIVLVGGVCGWLIIDTMFGFLAW